MHENLFNYPKLLKRKGNRILYSHNGAVNQYFTNDELEYLISLLKNTLEYNKQDLVDNEDIIWFNQKLSQDYWDDINKQTTKNIKVKKEPKKGYVYLAQNDVTKNIKIGFSKNPITRVSQLNLSSDKKIILLHYFEGTMEDEKNLHQQYEHWHLNSEWFSYNKNIINFFKFKEDEV